VQWSIFTNAQWAALTFVVMGVTVISYLLISFSSKKLPAASVAFYSYLQPVIAIAIAIMFYGERLTLMHLFAGALILLGLWLLNMENKKRNVYA
jgi:drug/metabolite transporter (DMT)-like permease